MKSIKYAFAFGLVAGFGVQAFADNPISSYHYLADPACTASDSVFYILTDSDDPAGGDGYTIKSLYGFSSRDMKNWTDHGIIFEAKREDNNINDIWASGIDINPNDGRMYIVLPDGGGGGVALIGADDIAGPWTNPVSGGKKLINNWGGGISDCDGIGWCFDPAIFFDTDGQGYFTFGGGSSDSRPAKDNNSDIFNIYKLDKDMKGFDVGSKTHLKVGGPAAMEASYIHKKGSTYYLSYSTADLRIGYATSQNIMGPYTYQGIVIPNPNINGRNINANNNNHHGIEEFKGKWYAVYHDRRLVQSNEHPTSCHEGNCNPNPEPAFHRSVSIDELTWSGDKMNELKFTDEGPEQIENFDPYRTYPAITSSKQRNIRSRTDWTRGEPVQHVLTPLASKESWIRVSGVDFGGGATNFVVNAANVGDGNKIEIHKGSASGALAGTCELAKTSGWKDYVENDCEVSDLTGIVDELFIVFKGSKDSTMGILEWSFKGAGGTTTPTGPNHFAYTDTPVNLPAVIQAEEFDKGGSRKAYRDDDAENQGDANFRADEGVDIVLGGTGKAIGYTNEGEWLLYTVNVPADGDYAIKASASTGAESTGFKFQVDGKDVGSEIVVTQTGEDWSVYKEFDGGSATLTAGEHTIKLVITGNNVNIDWFSFGDVSAIPVPVDPIDSVGQSVAAKVRFGSSAKAYNVYDLSGNFVCTVDLNGTSASDALKQKGLTQGAYMFKSLVSGKSFMAVAK